MLRVATDNQSTKRSSTCMITHKICLLRFLETDFFHIFFIIVSFLRKKPNGNLYSNGITWLINLSCDWHWSQSNRFFLFFAIAFNYRTAHRFCLYDKYAPLWPLVPARVISIFNGLKISNITTNPMTESVMPYLTMIWNRNLNVLGNKNI